MKFVQLYEVNLTNNLTGALFGFLLKFIYYFDIVSYFCIYISPFYIFRWNYTFYSFYNLLHVFAFECDILSVQCSSKYCLKRKRHTLTHIQVVNEHIQKSITIPTCLNSLNDHWPHVNG